MEEDERTPQRKTRTFEHVLEDLSENFLERKVLERGHVLQRPRRDYGVDVTMFHYAESGEIENGEIRFQLKASKSLKLIKNGEFISMPIATGDLHYWSLEFYPFIFNRMLTRFQIVLIRTKRLSMYTFQSQTN